LHNLGPSLAQFEKILAQVYAVVAFVAQALRNRIKALRDLARSSSSFCFYRPSLAQQEKSLAPLCALIS